jgi:hypothetical protein
MNKKLYYKKKITSVCGTPKGMKNNTAQNQIKKSWSPPAEGVMKRNVDAGVSRSAEVGAVAAVCRDTNGLYIDWFMSSGVYPRVNDPTTLEAMAINEGLSLALDLNLPKIQVASDCIEVINNLNQESSMQICDDPSRD